MFEQDDKKVNLELKQDGVNDCVISRLLSRTYGLGHMWLCSSLV